MPAPPLISSYQAKPLLTKRGKADSAKTSLDLGLTEIEANLDENGVTLGGTSLSWESLKAISKEDRKVFRIDKDPPEHIRLFSETTGWVRTLCPTAGAPTVLVSGIPMHRIKGTDPIQDTQEKLKALGSARGRILDTATGLGYTAIEAAKTADHVLTLEIDPGAIEMARLNPWSALLFKNPKIEQRIGDAAELIPQLPSGLFDGILHDPPTLALGGDLYGLDFYKELRRLLRRGGRLFHYIGDPNSAHGAKVFPGVMKRLSEAGFKNIQRQPAAFGVSAMT